MTMTGLEADVATAYRNFATREARGNSPVYEMICLAIADDGHVLELIARLPQAKRQPNLVLAATRFCGAPIPAAPTNSDATTDTPEPVEWHDLRAWLLTHWPDVEATARERSTQTNEPGRCAALLPFFLEVQERHGGPLALVEVGASAGLALYPDRYGYRYETQGGPVSLGSPAGPELVCEIQGFDTPNRLPNIGWRGGMDLNPLDITDADTRTWLDCLVWPDQDARRRRLDAAARIVGAEVALGSLHLRRGDLTTDLDALVADVPDDMPLVLFHTAVLAYTEAPVRREFEERMHALVRDRGLTWVSNEAPSVMPGIAAKLGELGVGIPAGRFVLALDGEPRAMTAPHGQALERIGHR